VLRFRLCGSSLLVTRDAKQYMIQLTNVRRNLVLVTFFEISWQYGIQLRLSTYGYAKVDVLCLHSDLRGRKWREAGEDCIMRSSITCRLP
jgi:hypothetical protein